MFRRASRSALILLAAFLQIIGSAAEAANRRWNNGTGSFVFNTAGNWQGGGTAPGVLDVAQFGISAPLFPAGAYTVNFNNNATNQALHIEDDSVTFNLNSRVYTLSAATGMVVGNQSNSWSGSLTVTNGTIRSTTGSNFDVGAAANRTGTLIVGANGLISGSPNLNIGKLGAGTLTVQADGDISTTGTTTIGDGDGITGTATILGNGTAGSATLVTGALNVGSIGDGTVNIQFGGLVQNNGGARLGTGSIFTGAGIGIVNVMNAGSLWNSVGLLEIGEGGSGEVNITLGGKVTGVDTEIGSLTSGEVNVDGQGSLWDSSGTLTIGALSAGTLNITNQGVVENEDGFIGNTNTSTSIGTVTVNGAGSLWRNTNAVVVGYGGTGTLNIANGGSVQSSSVGYVGFLSGSTGNVTVDGIGSIWDTGALLVGSVGSSAEGTLTITAGGVVQGGGGLVGGNGSSVTVDGNGSRWDNSVNLAIGGVGQGTLEITGGGHVSSVTSGLNFVDVIGGQAGHTGLVTVDGNGSLWHNFTGITVGDEGDGTLEITGGGTVIDRLGVIGKGSGGTGHVTVDGDGSLWDNTDGALNVGSSGQGTLEITGGAIVQDTAGSVGVGATGIGHVTVNGDGSQWDSASLTIGFGGEGTLDITAGGVVTAASEAFIGREANSTGTVMVTGAGSTLEIGGQLAIGCDFGAGKNSGTGTLHIQPGGTVNVTLNTFLSAGDLLSLQGGTLSTSQIRFQDGGAANTNFEWTSGTLHVGFFDGDLVNQAGVLARSTSVGLTVIDGNYNQFAGATLQIELGLFGHDFVQVNENAFLGGNLELALVNFLPSAADTFTVFEAGLNIFNSFVNVANGGRLTTSDGLGSFVVNYGAGSTFNPNQVVLSNFLSAAGVPGDYNNNGTVDAADYVLWRKGGPLANEVDNPGTVNAADYTAWRARFGNPGSGSGASANAAVPEPAALLLVILAMAGWSLGRGRVV